MNEKIKQLLDILLQQKDYLTALQLSEMLGLQRGVFGTM